MWNICYINRWLCYNFYDSLFHTGKGENIIKNNRILIFWKRKKCEILAILIAAAAIDKHSMQFNYDSLHHSNPLQFSRIWDNRTLLYQNRQKIDLSTLIFDHIFDHTSWLCLPDIIFHWFRIVEMIIFTVKICQISFKNASENFGNISYSRDNMVRLNLHFYCKFLCFPTSSASSSLWTTLCYCKLHLWCPKFNLEWLLLVDIGAFFWVTSYKYSYDGPYIFSRKKHNQFNERTIQSTNDWYGHLWFTVRSTVPSTSIRVSFSTETWPQDYTVFQLILRSLNGAIKIRNIRFKPEHFLTSGVFQSKTDW